MEGSTNWINYIIKEYENLKLVVYYGRARVIEHILLFESNYFLIINVTQFVVAYKYTTINPPNYASNKNKFLATFQQNISHYYK